MFSDPMWLAELVQSVQSALDLAHQGVISDSTQMLSTLEATTGQVGQITLEPVDVKSHAIFWVTMQRAALLSEEALLDEAGEALERVRKQVLALSGKESADCFCQEIIISSLELSKVYAAQGRFNAAIELLQDLSDRLPWLHYSADQLIDETIVSLVEMWGNYLGYDNLAMRLRLNFAEGRQLCERWPKTATPAGRKQPHVIVW